MTISSTDDPRAGPFNGNGSQTAFPFEFKTFSKNDLLVVRTDDEGVDTDLVLDSDFSVALNSDQDVDPGGTVTYPISGAALPVGETLTIASDLVYTQTTDITNGGGFYPRVIEDALDRNVMLIKQVNSKVDRALQLSVTTPDGVDVTLPTPVASNVIGWDADGLSLANYATDTAISTAVLENRLADGDDAANGDEMIGVKRTGAGATARTQHDINEERVISITDYGGQPGAGFNNTAAMDAAALYLNSIGGGVIRLPFATDWYMNWVCLYNNITVEGVGGKGEYDLNCIRPYSLASPPITFGNGVTIVRYCALRNLHVSGTDATAAGVYEVAHNAPYTLLLKGGVVTFTAERCVFYNGVRTVGLVPSATQPVTSNVFLACVIRNDLDDSATARGIYSLRLADPGYNTSNKFIATKLNGPTLGYAAEFDGTANGITVEINDSYWDVKPGKGVFLKGGSGIVCHNFQLDPGALGEIIISCDSAGDISRFIVGNMRHGGQKIEFPLGSEDIPAEADTWSYQARHLDAYMAGNIYLNPRERHYDTQVFIDMAGNSGPVRLNGADLTAKSTSQAASLSSAAISTPGGIASAKDYRCGGVFYVYGGNATAAGDVQANSGGGGLYFEAIGTNQNLRFVPSGTGVNSMGGAGTQPTADNTQTLGNAGNRWSTVYAGTGAINTSDEETKQDIEAIPAEWLAAWSDVQFYRYRFKDAVTRKGGDARWHVGVIAQRVQAAFTARGLDAFEIGLLCYDEWGDEFEDVRDEEGGFTGEKRLVRPAGRMFGVRYEEALIMECAYLRSRLDRGTAAYA